MSLNTFYIILVSHTMFPFIFPASSAQLNMRAVFLHVLGDALGSVIVIISACIIWFVKKDWVYYVDPAMR